MLLTFLELLLMFGFAQRPGCLTQSPMVMFIAIVKHDLTFARYGRRDMNTYVCIYIYIYTYIYMCVCVCNM